MTLIDSHFQYWTFGQDTLANHGLPLIGPALWVLVPLRALLRIAPWVGTSNWE